MTEVIRELIAEGWETSAEDIAQLPPMSGHLEALLGGLESAAWRPLFMLVGGQVGAGGWPELVLVGGRGVQAGGHGKCGSAGVLMGLAKASPDSVGVTLVAGYSGDRCCGGSVAWADVTG